MDQGEREAVSTEALERAIQWALETGWNTSKAPVETTSVSAQALSDLLVERDALKDECEHLAGQCYRAEGERDALRAKLRFHDDAFPECKVAVDGTYAALATARRERDELREALADAVRTLDSVLMSEDMDAGEACNSTFPKLADRARRALGEG